MRGRRRGRIEMRSEFWLCYRAFGEDAAAVRMVDAARAAVVRDTAERARLAGFASVRVFAAQPLAGLTVERTRADAS